MGGNVPAPVSPAIIRRNSNRLLICTNRLGILTSQEGGASFSNNTDDSGRVLARVGRAGYHSVRLAFGNYYVGIGEKTDVSSIAISAALETTSPAANRAFTFQGGSRSALLAAGDLTQTDPMYGILAGGTDQFFRTGLTVSAAGNLWPAFYTSRGSGEGFRQSTSGVLQVYNTGALTTAGTSGNAGFGPIAAIGMPLESAPVAYRRAFICFGDSIMRGNGGTPDAAYNNGYARGLVDPNGYVIPNVIQARDSDQAQYQTNTSTAPMSRKLALWPYATDLICNYGTNDLVTGARTLAQLQADLQTIWGYAKGFGLRTAQVLLTPRQASAGGTIVSGFEGGGTLRDPHNAWLRSQVGKGLLDAVIDVNQYVEDPAAPGKYLPGTSVDGLHMNDAGYNLAIPAIQAYVTSTM